MACRRPGIISELAPIRERVKAFEKRYGMTTTVLGGRPTSGSLLSSLKKATAFNPVLGP